jgi:diaminopimelate epimerase
MTQTAVPDALPFVKMQGIGNDFVVVDCLQGATAGADTLQAASVQLCDRRFGIGGDGVLLVLPSSVADFQMRMFNPDASEAEMCGNGIRCFAKFVADSGYTDANTITVETLGGVKRLEMTRGTDGRVERVKVDMGAPGLNRSDLPMTGDDGQVIATPVTTTTGDTLTVTGVSMGNPHVVFFVDDLNGVDITRVGPTVEHAPVFPRRTNVHAAQILSRSELRMTIWERGAGATLGCGTGACAVVVAAHLNGLTDRRVLAHLPGGDLHIEWSDDNHVYMTGPAETVFEGSISLPVNTL